MDKKSLLVILIAAILAFVVVFFAFKKAVPTDLPDLGQQKIVEEQVEKEQVEQERTNTVIKKEVKENIDSVKKSTKQTEELTFKPLKIDESEPATVEKTEENLDLGIIKDAITNEVVITREFKFQSPSKYSFK